MQPSYVLLPATSYPKAVGGMCYAKTGAHINKVKSTHESTTNQGPGDKVAWVLDMPFQHADAQS